MGRLTEALHIMQVEPSKLGSERDRKFYYFGIDPEKAMVLRKKERRYKLPKQ